MHGVYRGILAQMECRYEAHRHDSRLGRTDHSLFAPVSRCRSNEKQFASHSVTLHPFSQKYTTNNTQWRYEWMALAYIRISFGVLDLERNQFCVIVKQLRTHRRRTTYGEQRVYLKGDSFGACNVWYRRGIFLHKICDFVMHIATMKLCVKRR